MQLPLRCRSEMKGRGKDEVIKGVLLVREKRMKDPLPGPKSYKRIL